MAMKMTKVELVKMVEELQTEIADLKGEVAECNPPYQVTQTFGKNAHDVTDFGTLKAAQQYYDQVSKPDFSRICLMRDPEGDDEELQSGEHYPDYWKCEQCGNGKPLLFAMDYPEICLGCYNEAKF